MTNEHTGDNAPKEEGWVEVGEAPAPQSLAELPPDDEHRPFETRKFTPPWKYSVYTAVAGLVLMIALFIFPELRRANTPWNPAFPIAAALMVFPAFAIVWGLIGALGKPYRDDAGRAIAGVVLGLLSAGLGYVVITTDESSLPESPAAQSDERLQMSPQELQEWRSEKLNR